jgi:hypothetical protein
MCCLCLSSYLRRLLFHYRFFVSCFWRMKTISAKHQDSI